MKINLLRRSWLLRFCKIPPQKNGQQNLGECDPPHRRNKEIRIEKDLQGQIRLQILLHEMLHAADWWKDEEWVDLVSEEVAEVLWRLGYRDER